jgi:hypothetical protein
LTIKYLKRVTIGWATNIFSMTSCMLDVVQILLILLYVQDWKILMIQWLKLGMQ